MLCEMLCASFLYFLRLLNAFVSSKILSISKCFLKFDVFCIFSERLSDNLRLSQVPIVHAQVFLCYRVLLIRQKPQHLVSMWPSMVTELVLYLVC